MIAASCRTLKRAQRDRKRNTVII